MEKSELKVVIRDAISRAARAQGWTIAQLAERLDVGVSTLHRWKSNKSTTFDLAAVVDIFNYAGLSMDQAFALNAKGGSRTPGAETASQIATQDPWTLQTLLGMTKALSGITHQMEEAIAGSLRHSDEPSRAAARRAAVDALTSLSRERYAEEQVARQAEAKEA